VFEGNSDIWKIKVLLSRTLYQTLDLENFAMARRSSQRIFGLVRHRSTLTVINYKVVTVIIRLPVSWQYRLFTTFYWWPWSVLHSERPPVYSTMHVGQQSRGSVCDNRYLFFCGGWGAPIPSVCAVVTLSGLARRCHSFMRWLVAMFCTPVSGMAERVISIHWAWFCTYGKPCAAVYTAQATSEGVTHSH